MIVSFVLVCITFGMMFSSARVDCGILQDCLAFLEGLLDKPAGPAALEKFFDPTSEGGDLVKILLSIASPQTAHSPQYGTRVLRFFNRIFAAGK